MRKVNNKTCEYNEICMYSEMIEDKLYNQLVNQFTKRKMNQRDLILHYLTIGICFMMDTRDIRELSIV